MSSFFAPASKDAYKIYHPFAYPAEMESGMINFTNRHNKHTNIPDNDAVAFIGLQYLCLEYLIKQWNETFFDLPQEEAVARYQYITAAILKKKVSVEHIRALHKVGYLPIRIRAVEEGTFVPYGVPSMTIQTTKKGLPWVGGMLETQISTEIWPMCTSATTAAAFREGFNPAIAAGLPEEMVDYMGHDFSMRGMFGSQAAAMSGFAHLCMFVGSDTMLAALFAERYYGADLQRDNVIASVDATEHSIEMSNMLFIEDVINSTGKYNGKTMEQMWGRNWKPEHVKLVAEMLTIRRLATKVSPTGILSYVSDGNDFWQVVTQLLPRLKGTIMRREGTFVVRPDSGDPVKIITGMVEGVEYRRKNGIPYPLEAWNGAVFVGGVEPLMECEVKGLVEVLWDIFGGTTIGNGLRLLDDHIGAIYGDSITLERQSQIISRLVDKGFVPTVVLGIGSYTYQYVTRDTHGSAVKLTDGVFNGKHIAIYKDPKTDQSKKSAAGLLMVVKDEDGKLVLLDNVTPEQEASDENQLTVVFEDGVLVRRTTLEEIRVRMRDYLRNKRK